MSLKTEIRTKFKEKFPKVNLSNKRLDAIIDKIDGKIEKEDEIEPKLDELNEVLDFAEIARLDDLERITKEKKPKDEEVEKPKNEDEESDDEKVPAWAKAILSEVSSLKAEKVVNSRKAVAETKFKDAPEAFKNDLLADLEELNFKDDEHFNSYLERKERAFSELKQFNSDAGLGNDKPLNGLGGDGKKATEKEVESIVDGLL